MKNNNSNNDELWNDLLDDRTGLLSSIFLNRKFWSYFTLILAGFSLGYIVWAGIYGDEVDVNNVPYLRADTNPYKVKADDSVNADIPLGDSTVFEAIVDDGLRDKAKENIVVEKEEYVDRESLFAGLKTEIKSKPIDKKLKIENELHINKDIKKPVARPKIANRAVKSVKESYDKKVSDKKSSGNWYVQLGSVKSYDGAVKEWERLKNVFSSELSGEIMNIQKAEIPKKGVFFRIRAGGMAKNKAVNICEKIKIKKAGACLVVKD